MEVSSSSDMLAKNEGNNNSDNLSNDTPEDKFMYLIDLAIEYGNINYIKIAINNYKDIINYNYILNANKIMMELLEEKVEEMTM